MSESVIADFVGTFSAENTPGGEPVRGRIICSEKRLVLAADSEHSLQIPLSSIFDIAVGHVPPDLGDFFDSTVTIAFERDDRRYVAAVEATDDHIGKFATVLFKAILNGTEVTVQHPARRGGRVTDEPFVASRLALEDKAVTFLTDGGTVAIELARVTRFDRETRVVDGGKRPVLVVNHMDNGQAVMTLAATPSPRKMSLLGRYLRREYADLLGEVQDVELTEEKMEVIVALYSGADAPGVSLSGVLGMESATVSMLLSELEADDLVTDTDRGTTLTPKGRVVATNSVEDVNA